MVVKREPSSGFFWDVAKFRGSRSAQRMSFSERGVYREMLDEQWERRSLPDDAQAVAEAICSTDAQIAEVLAAWPVVRRKFVSSKGDPGRIYNVKLEETRKRQRENRKRHQDAGRSGGNAKAVNARAKRTLQASDATCSLGSAVAKPTDLTRRDVTRPDLKRSEEKEQEIKNSGARAPRPVDENLRLVTKFAHEAIEMGEEAGDLSEAVKSLCAIRGVAYPFDTVRRAIDSALAQRARQAS